MTARWRWTLIIGGAAALDLLARFGSAFDFDRIMRVEAVLFPVTGILLGALAWHEPRAPGRRHGFRVGLAWFFLLGGLRPLLWTLGVPLMAANLASLGAALAVGAAWMLRRRRSTR